MSNYIEPRLRRDFGGIVTAFFNFLKGNLKGLINVFVGYNGPFFILFLVSVYFMVTGLIEYFVIQNSTVLGGADATATSLTIGFSAILLLFFIALATIFNYAISSSYMSLYELEKKNNIPKAVVWQKAKSAFWGVFLLGCCAVVMYFIYFIVQIVLAFIPIVGTIVSVVIGLGFNAWISLAIFSYVHNNDKNIIEAFGESWQLLFSGFWKAIGVNFVLGFLVQISLFALQIGPAIIAGVIIFHAVDNSGDFSESTISHILIIAIVTLFCVLIMFLQMISQVINAFVYFNLHEFKHNVYLRGRIEKIGSNA